VNQYAKKRDANHGEIEKALTQIGVGVLDTSALGEFVDLVTFFRGTIRLLEIKDGDKPPSARKLTLAQQLLHNVARLHGCEIHVVTSVDEALRLHGARV
jgi:hypothetical protein